MSGETGLLLIQRGLVSYYRILNTLKEAFSPAVDLTAGLHSSSPDRRHAVLWLRTSDVLKVI